MNSPLSPSFRKKIHEFSLRIYYEDTDAAGIVYHANYLKFMERGRTEWLRELGFEQSILAKSHEVIFVVVTLNLNFKKPARIDQKLSVRTSLRRLGAASIELNQILVADDSEINCDGLVRLGCVNAASWRATRIPEELRGKIYYGD